MKPILFNTEMVRKILSGEKTVTRRVVKPAYLKVLDSPFHKEHPEVPEKQLLERLCFPPFKEGDILYVRETWGDYRENYADGEGPYVLFRADYPDGAKSVTFPENEKTDYADSWDLPKWHPSIHMPREYARIFLRVTGVRVERLQKAFFEPICPILEVRAEGIDIGDHCRDCIDHYGTPCCVDTDDEDGSDLYDGECGMLDDPRDDFARLWDSTIAPEKRDTYGWAANPWVWVIEFERCEKPKEAVE